MTFEVATALSTGGVGPTPLQFEVSMEFVVAIAGTILLMLLFLMVVVLWDVALALRDVAEKIDYLEDDVDSDLSTINGTLTRIYDRMGHGSATSPMDGGAASRPAIGPSPPPGSSPPGESTPAGQPHPQTQNATGGAGDVADGGANARGVGAASGAAIGAQGTGARAAGTPDGRRPVADAPTVDTTADSDVDEATSDVDAVANDDRSSDVESADADADTEALDDETGSEGVDDPDVDADDAGAEVEGDAEADEGAADFDDATSEDAVGSPTVFSATDASAVAAGNAGRFASDEPGDAWYEVQLDLPPAARQARAEDRNGVEVPADRERTGEGPFGLNRPGVRSQLAESGDGDGDGDGVEYVDPVSQFGNDEDTGTTVTDMGTISFDDLHESDATNERAAGDTDADDTDADVTDADDAREPESGDVDAVEVGDRVEDGLFDEDATDEDANGEADPSDEDGLDAESDASDGGVEGDESPEAVAGADQSGEDDSGSVVADLASTKDAIRERHTVDGSLSYASLQQEAARTPGVKGSGMPAEEMLDALAAAHVHGDGIDDRRDVDEAGGNDEVGGDDGADANVDADADTEPPGERSMADVLGDADVDPPGTDADALRDALANRQAEDDDDGEGDSTFDQGDSDVNDVENAGDDGIAELVNRELDTLTQEVGGTSMTPDVSNEELDAAVDELDDGSYTFPLSGSRFTVGAVADAETATLSFTPDEAVDLGGARERLLTYQLRNYLDRDDTAHAELAVDDGTVTLEIPAANGQSVDAWADAAVQIIDRTLYLSKDDD